MTALPLTPALTPVAVGALRITVEAGELGQRSRVLLLFGGPGFESFQPQAAHNHPYPRQSDALFWPLSVLHISGVWPYIQTKHTTHKNNKRLKRIKLAFHGGKRALKGVTQRLTR